MPLLPLDRVYLHDAASSTSGTLPAAGSSAFGVTLTNGGIVTGGDTNRSANSTLGTAETSVTWATTATTSQQKWLVRRFIWDQPLDNQALRVGFAWNLTQRLGFQQDNANCNISLVLLAGIWRPSGGGSFISRINPSTSGPTNGSNTSTSKLFSEGTTTISVSQQDDIIAAGDVLFFEVIADFTQDDAVSYNPIFYYDGTSNTSSTSCGSYWRNGQATRPGPIFYTNENKPEPGKAAHITQIGANNRASSF